MQVNIKVTSSKYDRDTFAIISEVQVDDSNPKVTRILIDRAALQYMKMLSGSSAQRLEQLRVIHLEELTKAMQSAFVAQHLKKVNHLSNLQESN